MKLRTKAKVNLFLRILGKRQDGYHELETILHSVDLADDIEVTPTRSGEVDVSMDLSDGMLGKMPAASENLVAHAATALLAAGARNEGVALHITKRIPIAAGLGGGSGNAAGALVALNQHWGLALDRKALIEAAATLGSDIPYCLHGGTALASGRGENLVRLSNGLRLWVVLGMTNGALHTRDVYAEWQEQDTDKEAKSAPMVLAIGAADVAEIASLLHNDLEAPAFRLRPDLAVKKQAMLDAGALGSLLSGSGPTIFGLAADEAAAQAVAEAVQDDFDRVDVVESSETCVEMLDVALP